MPRLTTGNVPCLTSTIWPTTAVALGLLLSLLVAKQSPRLIAPNVKKVGSAFVAALWKIGLMSGPLRPRRLTWCAARCAATLRLHPSVVRVNVQTGLTGWRALPMHKPICDICNYPFPCFASKSHRRSERSRSGFVSVLFPRSGPFIMSPARPSTSARFTVSSCLGQTIGAALGVLCWGAGRMVKLVWSLVQSVPRADVRTGQRFSIVIASRRVFFS